MNKPKYNNEQIIEAMKSVVNVMTYHYPCDHGWKITEESPAENFMLYVQVECGEIILRFMSDGHDRSGRVIIRALGKKGDRYIFTSDSPKIGLDIMRSPSEIAKSIVTRLILGKNVKGYIEQIKAEYADELAYQDRMDATRKGLLDAGCEELDHREGLYFKMLHKEGFVRSINYSPNSVSIDICGIPLNKAVRILKILAE